MIVEPKVRGFLCTAAHPEGCRVQIQKQIEYVKQQGSLSSAPKNVLVIGASTGYGLASRISAAFGGNANTIGVFFEKPASGKRTASPGWYNTAAFEEAAQQAGLYAKSINGDAFSDDIKKQVIELIQEDWQGKVDLVVYSLAAPRRTDPQGVTYQSVLKPVSNTYSDKTVDIWSGEVSNVSIEPATEEEVLNTEKVMGGDDWALWIDALLAANVLAPNALTVAYSYIGPKMTYPIYHEGTIGRAKAHLEKTQAALNKKLQDACGGRALVSVNTALVTQASAAIPVVPLYIALLYKVMKQKNIHEDCIEQIWRLMSQSLYPNVADAQLDDQGRVRIDDLEMRADVQEEVAALWPQVTSENIADISDIEGYRTAFYQLFGFKSEGIDYAKDVDVAVQVPSLSHELA